MSALLQRVAERVQDRMDEILDNFKPGAKITVLVRTPDKPTADFCMTDDDLDQVAAMVRRRIAEDAPAPPESIRPPISDDELEQWARLRADDAGHLARELVLFRQVAAAPALIADLSDDDVERIKQAIESQPSAQVALVEAHSAPAWPELTSSMLSSWMKHGNVKLPLYQSPTDTGVILDANGVDVLTVDVNNHRPDDEVDVIAMIVASSINQAAGFVDGKIASAHVPSLAPAPEIQLMGSEPAIIRLPWHKEPHGDFWRAEVIGLVYEVHDDEMADYKKRQCQYDFEARIRSALVPPATATEGSGE